MLCFHKLDCKPTGPGLCSTHISRSFLQDHPCYCVLPDPGSRIAEKPVRHPKAIYLFSPPSSCSFDQSSYHILPHFQKFYLLQQIRSSLGQRTLSFLTVQRIRTREVSEWNGLSLFSKSLDCFCPLFTWVSVAEPLNFHLWGFSKLRPDPDSRRGFRLQVTNFPVCQS